MKPLTTIVVLLLTFTAFVRAESPVYIDVRTAEEYSQGHIDGARLMPHDTIETLITAAGISTDTPVTLYCRSGRRAEIARQKLLELGYTRVTNAGGYLDLAAQLEACRPDTC